MALETSDVRPVGRRARAAGECMRRLHGPAMPGETGGASTGEICSPEDALRPAQAGKARAKAGQEAQQQANLAPHPVVAE